MNSGIIRMSVKEIHLPHPYQTAGVRWMAPTWSTWLCRPSVWVVYGKIGVCLDDAKFGSTLNALMPSRGWERLYHARDVGFPVDDMHVAYSRLAVSEEQFPWE